MFPACGTTGAIAGSRSRSRDDTTLDDDDDDSGEIVLVVVGVHTDDIAFSQRRLVTDDCEVTSRRVHVDNATCTCAHWK